jgi:hypothetical protein
MKPPVLRDCGHICDSWHQNDGRLVDMEMSRAGVCAACTTCIGPRPHAHIEFRCSYCRKREEE